MLKIFLILLLLQCNPTSDSKKKRNLLNGLIILNSQKSPSPNAEFVPIPPLIPLSTKFGIVGDSWTDFALAGVQDLRAQLSSRGYKISGTSTAGLRLSTALSQNLQRTAIDQAGSNIKYMIISLGGNDYQANLSDYIGVNTSGGVATNARILTIQNNLNIMIADGNSYKISKYGGGNLVWILHGYDYANILKNFCTVASPFTQSYQTYIVSLGASIADSNYVSINGFNALNSMMLNLANASSGMIRYIDLRGTLGGPPNSTSSSMYDCIHPTTAGFSLITDKYILGLNSISGSDR
jgi:hypothetical protein